MSNIIDNTGSTIEVPLRPCPFCGSPGRRVVADDQVHLGVECSACSACIPATHTEFEALFRWNRRSGGIAGAGGRATKGISTARKRGSSRANLALARQSKQMMAIRAETEEAVARLRPCREAEQRELEAQAAWSRARLTALLPRLAADPVLKEMVGVLKRD